MGVCRWEEIGQNSKSCYGKIQRGAVVKTRTQRTRPFQKQQRGGSSALIKTSLRVLDTHPRALPQGGGVFRNPKESSLLFGNIYEQPHPSCVDLAKARWKGAVTGRPSTTYKIQCPKLCLPLPNNHVPLAQLSRLALWAIFGVELLLS